MRLRKGLILKVGVVAVFLIFVIPYLISLFGSPEDQPKSRRKRINFQNEGNVLRFDSHGAENVMHQPLHAPFADDNQPVGFGEKVYGPQTVFKTGVLGKYELREVKKGSGPGENGEPVYTTMEEKAAADKSIRDYGFNMVASDKVSLDRVVPDTRMEECKYWHYPEKLPKASVILVFHNEGWSTLIRTVHSVINMSPPELLHEIVMVDDYSDKEHLKLKLKNYLKRFKGKVKLFRNEKREGLIRTRTLGAQYSTGEVIIFLDAHCECNYNWLPPLLARIAYDRTIMAVPIVEGIHWDNFRYAPVYTTDHHRGIFEWGFLYKESRVPSQELQKRGHHSAPYWSPTHAGGLFAMDRKYFFQLGGYDPGLQIWGGENFELSFKIWQCGGSIEWVPCSRVGHVYRNHMPYGFGNINSKVPVVLLNYLRVVEVWLDDEFKEYYYRREPTIRGYPPGNITAQLKFKKDHKCHSFKWFMDNIAYEVYDRFPPPPANLAWGEIKLKGGSKCWDTLGQGVGGGSIGTSVCHHYGGNQLFRLNVKGQFAVGERCLLQRGGDTISVHVCDAEPTGPWDFNKKTGQIQETKLNRCAEVDDTNHLRLKICNEDEPNQQWEINPIVPWR
ncbi:N-acetylgalactosaminyltransferase 7-like [Liolophura sinensis]|uniref:N-acetylgalactosaminyltransferase 7-like n=1 Tax=Liolophura sinensis TaxID=3198878 RepID=UPI0031584511